MNMVNLLSFIPFLIVCSMSAICISCSYMSPKQQQEVEGDLIELMKDLTPYGNIASNIPKDEIVIARADY